MRYILQIIFSLFVGGYLGPIDTPKYINCNAIRNVQFQFDAPPNVTTIYSKVPGRQRSLDVKTTYKPDASRKVAYELIEDILTREGKNGRDCILRTICEVSETPLSHNGLVGELLQIFFTPGKYERIHQDYRDASKAGINRVNCAKMYPECPFGHGILDTISLIEQFKFSEIFSNS